MDNTTLLANIKTNADLIKKDIDDAVRVVEENRHVINSDHLAAMNESLEIFLTATRQFNEAAGSYNVNKEKVA